MKYMLCTLLASCSTLSAFHGLYMGGSLGAHLAEGTQSGGGFGERNGVSCPGDVQPDMFNSDLAGMVYVGYGMKWRALYCAVEGFAQFGSVDLYSHNSNPTVGDNGVTLNFDLTSTGTLNCCQGGVDILPGWVPNPATLLYGRIGVSVAHTALTTSAFNFIDAAGDLLTLSALASQQRTAAVFHAGGGVEFMLTKHLSLRSDYTYTDYGSLSVQSSSAGISAGDPASLFESTKLHMYDHAALFGLNYRFCGHKPICLDPCCIDSGYRGAFFGGSLGGSALTSSQTNGSVHTYDPLVGLNVSVTSPSQVYNNQVQGALFFGYGRPWEKGYLAGEVFATGATHTTMQCNATGIVYSPVLLDVFANAVANVSLESSSWQFGFDFRPGFMLTPLTLFYGRVGCAAAKILLNYNGLSIVESPIGTTSSMVPGNVVTQLWRPAFRLGVGLEQILTSYLHLRADYIFTNFGIISMQDTSIRANTNGDATFFFTNVSSHLQNNAIVLGLSYYFHGRVK